MTMNPFGVGRANVIEQMVLAAGERGELVHRVLHDGRRGKIEGVGGFARLEVDVGILRGAADDRMVRREAARDGAHQFVIDHGADVVHGELFDFGDLVRGAEAIEEVQKGNARFQRGGLRNQRKVHGFLNGVGGQHCPSGGAGSHHVAVIAKDGERLRGQGARRDMEDGRRSVRRQSCTCWGSSGAGPGRR